MGITVYFNYQPVKILFSYQPALHNQKSQLSSCLIPPCNACHYFTDFCNDTYIINSLHAEKNNGYTQFKYISRRQYSNIVSLLLSENYKKYVLEFHQNCIVTMQF